MIRLLSIFTVLFLCSAVDVQALSCMPPQFDAAAIENLGIVFEGVVEKEEGASFCARIKNKLDDQAEEAASTYTFKITRRWKGKPAKNETVEIVASPGWEQEKAYQVGETYMVFGNSGDKPGVYKASPGWCGFDLLPKDEVIETLEQYQSEKNRNVD